MNLYLNTERLRFGERLRLEYAIEEPALEALVPSLLLQPLIENAVKYAISPREEGGSIRIEGRTRGAMLEIAVIDDGPGVRKTLRRGRARRRAAQHPRAALGTVRRAAPLRDTQQSPGHAHRDRVSIQQGVVGMGAKVRTIIVDDEALSRRGLEIRLLEAGDFEIVAQPANGREALAAIAEHRPDLVFLDIQMPGMSGFELLAQLPPESMPMVVFVTAFNQYAVRAFEARAIDYLLSPSKTRGWRRRSRECALQLRARNAENDRDRLFGLIAEITGSGESGAR